MYILGLLLGPLLTVMTLIVLIVIGVNPMVPVLFIQILFPYVPVYGSVAILYSIRSLLGLVILINFIPLAIFGVYCFRKGCMDLFAEWNDKYLGMIILCLMFSIWAFVLWLFVREKRVA